MSRRAAPDLGLVAWLERGDEAAVARLGATLRATGLHHLRLGISWAEYHNPDWAEWYAWLIPELARTAELVPCVVYTPPSIGLAPSTAAPPREPKAYADFLDVFVSEHGRHFQWVELWNEPNNLNDWDWRLDPDWSIFCTMVGGAAYWMRQRGKRTVLGGTCPTDPPLLELLRQNGVLDHIDAIGLHAFPGTWTPGWHGWSHEAALLEGLLQRCRKPPALWITEVGYSTWRHDEARQLEVFAEAARAPVERVYWYAFQDLAPDRSSQEGFHFDERHYHCGIVRADGQPKLLHRALAAGGLPAVEERSRRYHRPRPRAATRPLVITGGAGFIGANLADRLAQEGRHILIIDSLSRAGTELNLDWLQSRHGARLSIAIADVRDFYALRDCIADASAVVHLAAQVAVTTSLVAPFDDFEINGRGTLNVLESIRQTDPTIPLIFASTNKVYGKLFSEDELEATEMRWQPRTAAQRQGCAETTPLDLYSPYGCSKGVADQYVLDHARVFGLRTAVLRMSCIYGQRQFGNEDQGWVAHFVRQALTGQPVTIYGDGRQVRDLLFVGDAVEAYVRALHRIDEIKGCAFNLGGGPGCSLSLLELRHLMARQGLHMEASFGPWRPGDQLWYVSDTRRLARSLGWTPQVGVESGLARLLAWLRQLEGVAPQRAIA